MAKESINISNIPVVGRAPEDYLKLAEFLKEKDYVIRYAVVARGPQPLNTF